MALFPNLDLGDVRQTAASDEWFTPRRILDWLPSITLDPCWSPHSHVRPTMAIDCRDGRDGLLERWDLFMAHDGCVFVNPPYSDCAAWVEKCAREARVAVLPIVALVPAYAGDQYWHRAVWGRASWVAFLRGRVRFDTRHGRAASAASFTSALICWRDDGRVLQRLRNKAGDDVFVVRADKQAG